MFWAFWLPVAVALSPGLRAVQPARAKVHALIEQPGAEIAQAEAKAKAAVKADAPEVLNKEPESEEVVEHEKESDVASSAEDAAKSAADAVSEVPSVQVPTTMPDKGELTSDLGAMKKSADDQVEYAGYTPLAGILWLNDIMSPHGPIGTRARNAFMVYGISALVQLVVFYGIWMMTCQGKRRTTAEPKRVDFQGDLTPVGLFDCFSNNRSAKFLIEAIFCPVCIWSETVEKAVPKDRPCPSYDLGVFCRVVVTGFFHVLTQGIYSIYALLTFRISMMAKPPPREKVACLSGSCVTECCKVIFCFPCHVRQQADLVELYKANYNAAEFMPGKESAA
jgi:hypothetical protein